MKRYKMSKWLEDAIWSDKNLRVEPTFTEDMIIKQTPKSYYVNVVIKEGARGNYDIVPMPIAKSECHEYDEQIAIDNERDLEASLRDAVADSKHGDWGCRD